MAKILYVHWVFPVPSALKQYLYKLFTSILVSECLIKKPYCYESVKTFDLLLLTVKIMGLRFLI